MIEWSLHNEPCGTVSQDRVAIIESGQAHIAIVADGAGGTGGGRAAADAVPSLVEALRPSARQVLDPDFWVEALCEIDRRIEADPATGETTAVVVAVADGALAGASVGDSGALLFSESQFTDVTAHQIIKPLMGSGSAHPVGFGQMPCEGTLVAASDGLIKYATTAEIWGCLAPRSLPDIVASLVTLVRLPSGHLQDDVGIVVARVR